MKKLLITVCVMLLVGCATMMGGDRTVNVTGDQIAEKLNEKLAVPIQLLKIFDVNLSNSVVSFDETTARMTTTMDTNLSSEILDKSLLGQLGISGKLRFDPKTNAVVLDEPKVENFNVDGAGGQFNDLLSALAATVGGDLLNGLALYTVDPDDLKVGSTQYMPKDMVVTDKGLQLTLTPQ